MTEGSASSPSTPEERIATLERELAEAREQQAVAGEILRAIANSPANAQGTLDAIAEAGSRLLGADRLGIWRIADGALLSVARHAAGSSQQKWARRDQGDVSSPLDRGSMVGRAALDGRTINVDDLAAESEQEYPLSRAYQRLNGQRSTVAVPLLREGSPIGVLNAVRMEVRPFTDLEVELLETFADQAVIAIENARLFQELQERNHDLTESLEQQMATSEIFGVIAGSPIDIEAVLNVVSESARRLCDASDALIILADGDDLKPVAHHGPMPIAHTVHPLSRGFPGGRAVLDQRTIHIPDVLAELDTEYPDGRSVHRESGTRTILAAPLLREGAALGAIVMRRTQVRPFTDQQVALLETFADQAVIAIENARLFQELQDRNRDLTEALEQQTATSEILRIIASSPTELQPVLDAIAASAVRLCEASDAVIERLEGDRFYNAAHAGAQMKGLVGLSLPLTRQFPGGRAVLDRQPVILDDIHLVAETEYPDTLELLELNTIHSVAEVPLLSKGQSLGNLCVLRAEVRPFTDPEVALLKTFADQAVIAIENTRLFQELQDRNRDLTEALEQQTATSEILRVISQSPADLQAVLDAVAANAARLCDAEDVSILEEERGVFRVAAFRGARLLKDFEGTPVGRGSVAGRAIVDRQTIHIHDIAAELEGEFSVGKAILEQSGHRAMLAAPLFREGVPIGAIFISRAEARPFSEKQIGLLETFADQAVIAIENARLFQEIQDRNHDLAESLEQQTATSEILRVISSSPTELQPVLDAVAASAAQVCDASGTTIWRSGGDRVRAVARYGSLSSGPLGIELPITRGLGGGRAILERRTVHIRDLAAESDEEFPESKALQRDLGNRTLLATPLLREGRPLGCIVAVRMEVRPFSDRQIELLETFADQAVIAIENARLFQELQDRNRDLTEALEQQTATSEILRAIASSPAQLERVLDTVVESAERLCNADGAIIQRIDQGKLRIAAVSGVMGGISRGDERLLSRTTVAGRVFLERQTIHVHDLAADPGDEYQLGRDHARSRGFRAVLGTPLLRDGAVIGVLGVARKEAHPFTDQQIGLLETFADQAVIAIENTRLFQELQERNRDLTEALEQQTATSEILRVIASSPTDLQSVLDVLAENAARLCDATDANVLRVEGDALRLAAHYGPMPMLLLGERVPITRGTTAGRATVDRRTVHVDDITTAYTEFPEAEVSQKRFGYRGILATPLLREGAPIGVIVIRRMEVRPFTDQQIKLLETFADQAVIAIENTRLFEELRERTAELSQSVDELKALGEVGRVVSSSLNLQEVLETIVSHAVRLTETDAGTIYELDEPDGELRLRGNHGLSQELIEALQAVPARLGDPGIGQAVVGRQALQVTDLEQEPPYPMRDLLIAAGFRSVLVVPLLRDERIYGALVVRRRVPGDFPQATIDLLQTFADQSTLAIHNARLFREIEQKGRELEIASQHKSQFLANMSHELRTPLNAILGYTELIVDGVYGEPPERIGEVLDRVEKSGRHLLGLINDVLDLSKMEAGQLELALDAYSMGLVIQMAASSVGSLAAEKGLALEVELAPDLPLAHGDERRLTQVLLNLLGNALKFTEAGRVTVSAKVKEGAFVVAVTDTGPGISAEDQAKIFEEFQQADSSSTRTKGGTGLGLSIARRIVELHGGSLAVESTLGQGSTFTLRVPVRVERVPVET